MTGGFGPGGGASGGRRATSAGPSTVAPESGPTRERSLEGESQGGRAEQGRSKTQAPRQRDRGRPALTTPASGCVSSARVRGGPLAPARDQAPRLHALVASVTKAVSQPRRLKCLGDWPGRRELVSAVTCASPSFFGMGKQSFTATQSEAEAGRLESSLKGHDGKPLCPQAHVPGPKQGGPRAASTPGAGRGAVR